MKKILILESNESFALELAACFKDAGYDVCGTTGDGNEGIALIEKHSPDATVVSLMLRNADGISVLERAKGKTNFIVLGNFSDDAIIRRAIDAGARYYIMKPVSADVVGMRVEDVLGEAPKPRGEQRRRAVSLDERISNIFISIGIPPNIKGYMYLREGIKMTVEQPRVITNVTKGLYPVIAEKFDTSASKVERAIRHAIEVAWNRGRVDAINAIFGARVYIGSEKPTNSEFIALVADKLILEDMI